MDNTAILFPGQGSQSVGMLTGMDEFEAVIRATFDEAGDALDRDLTALVREGPEQDLNRTEWTQPAVLAGDVALWRIYVERGGEAPRAMAGHSLGEYAALVAAGALDFRDAIRVVHLRGRAMQAAVAEGEGSMAAVLGLDDAEVERICAETTQGDSVVVAANYNAPGQVVIAGARNAVERAVAACSQAGARRAMVLPVSVPSHTPLMQPATAPLAEALAAIEVRSPDCPVLHNLDRQPRSDPDAIRAALVDQLTHPVHWTGTIRSLIDDGVERFVECGPGRVLSGLGKRIERTATWRPLDDVDALRGLGADA
ncbi:ACP S-malonyltransferase [Wenzhouxiangella sp. XN79A]|uniref:ACP S-malonyltransferase n=1 Tax=Wenzhouxiangella sp. XN79A TaxID=2724193 RepID=UPI00144A4F93|nr:ACP S-malonyltransferase [Wenzhouxiangella sp. XN79A]NKI34478.1 ACP S-malonyltransferase [Wenzhouxiangella sp. XN79A]